MEECHTAPPVVPVLYLKCSQMYGRRLMFVMLAICLYIPVNRTSSRPKLDCCLDSATVKSFFEISTGTPAQGPLQNGGNQYPKG